MTLLDGHHIDLVDVFALQERNFRRPQTRFMPHADRALGAALPARIHRPLPSPYLSPYWEPDDPTPPVCPSAIWTTDPFWYALRLEAFVRFVGWVYGHLAALDPALEAAWRATQPHRVAARRRYARLPVPPIAPPRPRASRPSAPAFADCWLCLYCREIAPVTAWRASPTGGCPYCGR